MNIEHLVLGGERVPAADRKTFSVIEPGLGEPFAEVAEAGSEDIRRAVQVAYTAFIALGQQEGTQLALGGAIPDASRAGYFLQPTILAEVENTMRVAQEEIFGPVVCIIPFGSEEEAIRCSNDVAYGLSGSVWTRAARHEGDACRRTLGQFQP
jgi:aldehyde dehydrogenase (NAD+)